MGFSGLWVVWSLLGAPGEKKKEKTKCIYNTCSLLATLILKILQILFNFRETFSKISEIFW